MMWNWIKTWVKNENHDFQMPAIRDLALQRAADLNDSGMWLKAYNHSHKFALDYLAADEAYYEQLEHASADGNDDDDNRDDEDASDDEWEDVCDSNDNDYVDNTVDIETNAPPPAAVSTCTIS